MAPDRQDRIMPLTHLTGLGQVPAQVKGKLFSRRLAVNEFKIVHVRSPNSLETRPISCLHDFIHTVMCAGTPCLAHITLTDV